MTRIVDIEILEPHLASNETRDQILVSRVFIDGREFVLTQLTHDQSGVARTYADREIYNAVQRERYRMVIDGKEVDS